MARLVCGGYLLALVGRLDQPLKPQSPRAYTSGVFSGSNLVTVSGLVAGFVVKGTVHVHVVLAVQ